MSVSLPQHLSQTHVQRTLEEEDELEVDLLAHLRVPSLEVVLVAGEPVDEEVLLAGLLREDEQRHGRVIGGMRIFL